MDQFAGPLVDSWLYSALPDIWGADLCEDAKKTLAYGGYYQTLVRPGLRVVSINSNIYATGNLFLNPANLVDVSSQLNWLSDVLRQVKARDERVLLIGHQSPSSWWPEFSARFNALLTEYAGTVLHAFWGHTHHSEVQLYTDDADPPRAHTVGYIGGSFTPYTDTNPGFQCYTYDRATASSSAVLVNDYSVYWVELSLANARNAADWAVHMTARADLQLRDLGPSSWLALADSIAHGDSKAAFNALATAFRRGWSNATGVDPKDWGCTMQSDTDAKRRACLARLGEHSPQEKERVACDAPSSEEQRALREKVRARRAAPAARDGNARSRARHQ